MSEPGSYDQLISDEESIIKDRSEQKKQAEIQKIKDEYEIISHKSEEQKKAKQKQFDDEIKAQKEIQDDLSKKIKLKINQLLEEQFVNLIQRASDMRDPQVNAILDQTFQIILRNVESLYIQQAKLIRPSDTEIENEMHIIKDQIIKHKTQTQVKQEIKKLQLDEFEEELQSFKDDYLPEPDSSSPTTSEPRPIKENNNYAAAQTTQKKHYFASNFIPYQSPQGETSDSLNGKSPT